MTITRKIETASGPRTLYAQPKGDDSWNVDVDAPDGLPVAVDVPSRYLQDVLWFIEQELRDPSAVPASRYGCDVLGCLPVAVAVARILHDVGEPGDEMPETLGYAMGLVVNSHDDPAALIRNFGTKDERTLISD